MHLRSRGLGTDLLIAGFDGELLDRGDYLVALTPANPTFWFGNFVLFRDAPRPGERERWERVFAEEVGSRPGVGHVNLLFDRTDGEVGAAEEFVDGGYLLLRDLFLRATGTRPTERRVPGAVVRPLEGDAEWAQALAVLHATAPGDQEPAGFRAFQTRNHARYRRMAEAGFGFVYGAFEGDRVVATMGIFGPDGLSRCQTVATHPDFQRRGYAASLVHGACEHARAELGSREIWMRADAEGGARRVYERVGFEQAEQVAALARARPPDGPGAAPG